MLNIRLPETLESELAEEAQRRNESRSEVARNALKFYLRVQCRKRYLGRMQQAAQHLDAAQAYALADESLPFDNDVLAVAEASLPGEPEGMDWWR